MKKIHLIFRILLLIELTIIGTTLFFGDSCGSACDPHSLFNPFGVEISNDAKKCIMMCAWRPHDYFYITSDLFLLTIILYMISWIVGKKIHIR